MKFQVLAITSDLFLQSRIIELAKASRADTKIVTREEDLVAETNSNNPSLVILDLASTEYDPFSCAKALKSRSVPPRILAIYPHTRTDLRLRAQEAKIEYISPNSSFLKTLKTILEKEVVRT